MSRVKPRRAARVFAALVSEMLNAQRHARLRPESHHSAPDRDKCHDHQQRRRALDPVGNPDRHAPTPDEAKAASRADYERWQQGAKSRRHVNAKV
jgi:hypothetical protein